MRQHAGVFGSLLAVAAIVSGLALGVLALIDRAATVGVRSELAARGGEDGALRVSLRTTTDVASADAAVREAVAEAFRRDGRDIPLTVRHEVRSGAGVPFAPLDATAEGQTPDHVLVASIPDLSSAAGLVDGAWGASDDEATLQADAAAALGLVVGDRVEVGGRQLTLVGTWRVTDGLAPRWVGDSMLTRGTDAARLPSFGPLIVADSVWAGLADARRELWTIVPETADFEPADLGPAVVAWGRLDDTFTSLGIGEGLEQDGHFALTARELDRQVGALDATGPASLLLVAMIAIVTFIELGRLLTEVRTRELGLLWARGATPREVAGVTAAETAIAALLGVGIGVGAAAVLVAVGDPDGFARLGTSWWTIPGIVVLAAVLAVAAQAFAGTRRASRVDDPARSGRGQRMANAGLAVLVTLAAVLASWQLRLYGSPVTPDAEGGSSVDAIAVSAPALVVAAVVLGALLLFPRIARIAERRVSRSPQATGALAARSVARRLTLAATPIALLALAASQLLVAAGFAGSWERSHSQAHGLRAATELRVDPGPVGLSDAELAELTSIEDVTRLAPVPTDVVDLGDDDVRLLGVAADALAELGLDGGGTIDPAALADGIRVDPIGAALPTGADAITLLLVPDQPVVLDDVAVWLQTDDGLLRRAAAVPDAASDRYTASVPAPPVGAAWRLVGIDLTMPFVLDEDEKDDGIEVLLETATVDGEEVGLGAGWRGVDLLLDTPLTAAGPSGARLGAGASARLLPPTRADATTPVVVSRAVAATLGATVGTELSLTVGNEPLRTTVAAVVDGIPGSDRSEAMLIDSRALELALLRTEARPPQPDLAWIGARDPAAAAAAIRDALGGSARVVRASDNPAGEMLATSSLVLWVTAAGSAVLALVALGAVAGAQLRSRRDETAVLRALGFAVRQQGALRRRELLAVIAYGAVVGVVAGALVVIVVIAVFVRAAVPDSYLGIPTEVAVAGPSLALALAALTIAVLAFVIGYGALVSRQARTARVPEDAR